MEFPMSITTTRSSTNIPATTPLGRLGVSRLDTAALADIVSGLAQAEELWRPHVLHDPDERARVRLLVTPAYEVWLLGWTQGQSVGLHDHGGANAAFIVVDGTLTETAATDPTSRSGRSLTCRAIGAGQSGVVEAGRVHDIANTTTALATSIHAYSKPLRSMGFYETPEPDLRGHRVRTLWIDDAPPVLLPAAVWQAPA